MSENAIRVCLIGKKFMGRAHSNAYLKVNKFFDLAADPVMHTVCGRDRAELEKFKEKWHWHNCSVNWKKAVAEAEIDLVDITAPNDQHLEMTLAALAAGKHVACE